MVVSLGIFGPFGCALQMPSIRTRTSSMSTTPCPPPDESNNGNDHKYMCLDRETLSWRRPCRETVKTRET